MALRAAVYPTSLLQFSKAKGSGGGRTCQTTGRSGNGELAGLGGYKNGYSFIS